MTSVEALKSAVSRGLGRDPPDLQPAQVYADYLLENGDPLGELMASVLPDVGQAFKDLNELGDREKKKYDDLSGSGVTDPAMRALGHGEGSPVKSLADNMFMYLVYMLNREPGGDASAQADYFLKGANRMRYWSKQTLIVFVTEREERRMFFADELRKRQLRLDGTNFEEHGVMADPKTVDRLVKLAKKIKPLADKTKGGKVVPFESKSPSMVEVFLDRAGKNSVRRRADKFRVAAEAAARRWRRAS